MKASLASPTVDLLTEIAVPPASPPRPRFLGAFWELKIMFWGLVVVAVAYVATYAVAYAQNFWF